MVRYFGFYYRLKYYYNLIYFGYNIRNRKKTKVNINLKINFKNVLTRTIQIC